MYGKLEQYFVEPRMSKHHPLFAKSPGASENICDGSDGSHVAVASAVLWLSEKQVVNPEALAYVVCS
jgi:hypothetical protein